MRTLHEDPGPDADPVCPACSKPVRFKATAVVEHGELFHTVCRSRITHLQALELVDPGAQQNLARADDLQAQREARRATRWLSIVAWDHRHMAEDLQRRFEGRAEVLVDRRDRPGVTKPPVPRGVERREPLSVPEAAMWRDFGFRMVYRGELP
jgi:hypothetical protein